MKKFIYWLPRVLSILFILFLALFALDVFGEYGFPEILIALFMHLIPNFLLIIALVIAWKWEVVGGVIFLALGLFSIVFFDTYEHVVSFILVSLIPMIIGALFLLNKKYCNKKDKIPS